MTVRAARPGGGLAVKRQFTSSRGDVWAATWADDDALYLVSDDTSGIDGTCWSNVAVSKLTGDTLAGLLGQTINPLSDFGGSGEVGEDGATWKGTGLTCVDGVLYLALSRHRYGTPPYFIQQTWDAHILASEDHGITWTRPASTPTFPGRLFSNPNFVQVGQDGMPPDGMDDGYLYAISNDGSWNNGTAMILGRVPRDREAILETKAWQFWAGADSHCTPQWVSELDRADLVFRNPGRTSMTGITYLQAIGKYAMPQWHYLFDPATLVDRDWGQAITATPTTVELYTADHPWGPWSLRHSLVSDEGWYNPCALAKTVTDLDPGTIPVLVAGLGGLDKELYKLHLCQLPLDLLTGEGPGDPT